MSCSSVGSPQSLVATGRRRLELLVRLPSARGCPLRLLELATDEVVLRREEVEAEGRIVHGGVWCWSWSPTSESELVAPRRREGAGAEGERGEEEVEPDLARVSAI